MASWIFCCLSLHNIWVSFPMGLTCRIFKLSTTSYVITLPGIVYNFSSFVTFKFVDTQNEDLIMHELLMMNDDLSCQKFSPSLPLSMSVSLLVVNVGIFVYVSFLLVWPCFLSVGSARVSVCLHCKFVIMLFLVWCQSRKCQVSCPYNPQGMALTPQGCRIDGNLSPENFDCQFDSSLFERCLPSYFSICQSIPGCLVVPLTLLSILVSDLLVGQWILKGNEW